ncbi:MAG TPA: hypothetical protein VNL38_01460 [Candidatus Nitrosotenuis sp.]|nr:hypothetical protein [Candidatus Nitrosotenuis sp.]
MDPLLRPKEAAELMRKLGVLHDLTRIRLELEKMLGDLRQAQDKIRGIFRELSGEVATEEEKQRLCAAEQAEKEGKTDAAP